MTIQWYRYLHMIFLFLCFTLSSVPAFSGISNHLQTHTSHQSSNLKDDALLNEFDYCSCTFCTEIHAQKGSKRFSSQPKEWTVIVYMAADNDLRHFAARNLNQMAAIGSNDLFNLVVHLDIKVVGDKKITRRYYIEKNRIIHINADDPQTQKMDSGDPQTLYSCCEQAINEFPAKNYWIDFWNHGTGALDPMRGRIIHPLEFFVFNPTTNQYDLDRSVGFFDIIDPVRRGICWDDSTGNYLNNSTLKRVMSDIKRNLLKGKNFAIASFDACLMAMVEVASIMKESSDIMIASQEVELGTGWNYTTVLSLFNAADSLSPYQLAEHTVQAYKDTYLSITNDFACSAIDLRYIQALEHNINFVANLLNACLRYQKEDSVTNAIRASRHRLACTHFDEPSYLDLHHLYTNLYANMPLFKFKQNVDASNIMKELESALNEGCHIISRAVFSNVTGKNLNKAQGISIYFPEKKLHPSYQVAPFSQTNDWQKFLLNYLNIQ